MPHHSLRRILQDYLVLHPEDLEKMVFVAGPRQVGKTTLLQSLGPEMGYQNINYFDWDRAEDQKKIRDIHYTVFKEIVANSPKKPLVLLDEIHKYPKWKVFLKGYYDTFKGQISILVTGSARLDVYRRGGDSLLGRYWLFRLHPLSLSEVLEKFHQGPPEKLENENHPAAKETFETLLRWGGFPEPFLRRSDTTHARWIRMRRERLIREDLRDLSRIHDLGHIENLMERIVQTVGSTFSFNATREFLDTSYNAVKSWMNEVVPEVVEIG